MITCRFALLAKGVTRDAETGAISIYSIIEEIQSAAFPFMFPEVSFFAYILRQKDDPPVINSDFTMRINDEKLVELPMKLDFSDKMANRVTVRIGGLGIPNPGLLRSELVAKDGSILAACDVNIGLMRKPPKVEVETAPQEPQPPPTTEPTQTGN